MAEIEERKRFEAAIRLANHKINTLTAITRHDILNQITAVVMYLSLIQESKTDPVVNGYLEKIGNVTNMIQKQIQFTSDYQSIGASEPSWHSVSAEISEAAAAVDHKDVMIDWKVDDLEIFADSGFPKVFLKLIENAVIHGKHTSLIRFSYRETENELILSCEDNGVGIPEASKEWIFRRKYLRNTGYGLFLIVEILSIYRTVHQGNRHPGQRGTVRNPCPQGILPVHPEDRRT